MQVGEILTKEFKLQAEHMKNILSLIDEGNTIPFIARYRKELTGSCDDTTLRSIFERYSYLTELLADKQSVIKNIEEQGKMTEELLAEINAAQTKARLEDIYRPYKQKKRTRATIARERGLLPLAELILSDDLSLSIDPLEAAKEYLSEEVQTAEDALSGGCDIVAEIFSTDADIRTKMREYCVANAFIISSGDPEVESVYEGYYEFRDKVKTVADHRVLAVNRGEKENFLKVSIEYDENYLLSLILNKYSHKNSMYDTVKYCAEDSISRLIAPAIEREIRNILTERAAEGAIKSFAGNLYPLLMSPPLVGKTILGLDPGYRTGCKVAVINEQGKMLHHFVIYPTPPQKKIEDAKRLVLAAIKKYNIDVIAIGNGTATKESEIFVVDTIKECDKTVSYAVVSEAGASVYSASKLGAAEFPDLDVSFRSAVSIARRLLDPLAELVKIDPKSIGVGQYQHDLPTNKLTETLNGVVENCVNSVGVDLNTASPSLLSKISGITASVATNIEKYRDENGAFKSRKELLKVAKLGPKAFVQCAGFLRVSGGKEPFDATSVHPESYAAAKKLLKLFDLKATDIASEKIVDLQERISQYGKSKVMEECEIGNETLADIVSELLKPGRDIRESLPMPTLRSDLLDIKDLTDGMKIDGVVRNVVDFGAFVDIGVHQDGLVHISKICNKFIKHPSEVLKVGDRVSVTVLAVDAKKGRISLSMVD